MPHKTKELIDEYNHEYYKKNRESMLQKRRERYATDSDFKNALAETKAKWYKANREKISEARIEKLRKINPRYIQRKGMPPKKPKSARDLKIERITKNLAKIEERARIFREKLISQNNIQITPLLEDATQSQDSPTRDNERPTTTD
jgi:hypothetical protein